MAYLACLNQNKWSNIVLKYTLTVCNDKHCLYLRKCIFKHETMAIPYVESHKTCSKAAILLLLKWFFPLLSGAALHCTVNTRMGYGYYFLLYYIIHYFDVRSATVLDR